MKIKSKEPSDSIIDKYVSKQKSTANGNGQKNEGNNQIKKVLQKEQAETKLKNLVEKILVAIDEIK